MKLKYVEAMEEYGLKLADLPEDAQTGVDQINEVLKSIKMNEAKGRTITEKTYRKVRAMDKWVHYEILDLVNETDENEEEIPHTADEVEEEIEEQYNELEGEEDDDINDEETNEPSEGDSETGIKIDAELKIAYESGKTTITMDELKNVSRTAYNVIFENYDDSGDNGIVTTNYTLLESDEFVFTLEKN